MSLWSRIRNVFRGDRLSGEIDDELQFHLDEAVEHGRDPVEARRAFGSAVRHREKSRDIRLMSWLDSLRADVVFGWRQLMKKKVTSAAAILSLALAIGACTAAFRLIDALLWRPLPVTHPERLMVVAFENFDANGKLANYDSCSYPMFTRMRDVVKDQAELIAVSYAERTDLTYGSDQDFEKAYRQFVSGWMFRSFGVRPTAGRLLTASDDTTPGANPYAVLSYDYWTRRFGQDPKAIGRTFRIGDQLFEIVGVAEERFTGVETGTMIDIFMPMSMKTLKTLASYNNFWLRTFVQLNPGVSALAVHEKLEAIFRAIQQERAKGFIDMPKQRLGQFFSERLSLEPQTAGRSNLQREYRRPLLAIAVLVALVLLIASANIANLMTAQAAARSREMALRISIGAGRWRLAQLLFVESALVALLSAAVGGLLAWRAAPYVLSMVNPPDDPARLSLPMDWRVFACAAVLTLAVTFMFGLAPSVRASAVKPASALKGGDDSQARRRTMHALIAVQVAFSFVVLYVGGLFVATFERLSHIDNGYSAERILNLESVTHRPQPAVLWEQVAQHLRSLPGVESVSITTWPLMSGESEVGAISVDGAPPSEALSDFLHISPGWMDTMKIPFLGGRDYRTGEAYPYVAIVNESFSRQYFGGADPVGKSFDRVEGDWNRVHLQIVGYVRDARSRDLRMRQPIRPTVYVPFQTADAHGRGTFVVKTSRGNPLDLASILRQEVPRARSEFRVSNIRAQTEIIRAQTVRERLLAALALFFAAVAVLLAGIGLYGVLDYSVLQRRREIGIRMAIGARTAHIARRVTVEAFSMVLVGAAAGVALGIASVRYVESLLYGVRAASAGMLAIPSLVIVVAAMFAALPPVIRAVRIDPVQMLRAE